jgi:predicted PhzF superfamily epimerase YddE/YHI9
VVVQECAAGLVPVRQMSAGRAFSAPPLLRSGPVDEELVARIPGVLGIERSAVVDSQWVDNGPGWVAVLLASADEVLALSPGFDELDIGVVGPYRRVGRRPSRCGRSSRRTARWSRIP